MIPRGFSKWSGLMPVLEHVSFSTADTRARLACLRGGSRTTAFFSAPSTVPRQDAGCRIFEHASCRISITVTPGWKRNPNSGDSSMATQIVMDHTGDTRHHFDAKDLKALAEAERRFKALTGNGFTAATRQASGEVSLARSFDSNAEETVFYPRLVGG